MTEPVSPDSERDCLLCGRGVDVSGVTTSSGIAQAADAGAELVARYDRAGSLEDLNAAIGLFRAVAESAAASGHLRATALKSLAGGLQRRFDWLGSVGDLDEAISLDRESLELCPPDHADRASVLNSLAVGLQRRFNRLGSVGDLDEAVVRARESLELCPPDHADRASVLNSLAVGLQRRFDRLGALGDLDEAILLEREAVGITPADRPDRAMALNCLARGLRRRFDRLGWVGDLDEAISLDREAVRITSGDDPVRVVALNNLARCLRRRFDRLGSMGDVVESVALARESLELCPTGHPDRDMALNCLAHSLRRRFDRLGSVADLDEAIHLQREAVALSPSDDPDLAIDLNNLARCLRRRFDRLGVVEDLDEAIRLQREVVGIESPGHPDRATALKNLARYLRRRFDRLGSMGDLDESVALARESLESCPPDHPDRAMSLNCLAHSLRRRFDRLGSMGDLDEAILLQREAVGITPADYPDLAARMDGLGRALYRRFGSLGGVADLVESVSCAARAVVGSLDRPLDLADFVGWLADVLFGLDEANLSGRVDGALSAVFGPARVEGFVRPAGQEGAVLGWVPVLVRVALGRVNSLGAAVGASGWATGLARVQGLAATGAYASARLDDLSGAVGLLEQGSAVLAGARLSQQEAVLSLVVAGGHQTEVEAYRAGLDAVAAATVRGAGGGEMGPLVEELLRARGVVESLWGAPLAPQATRADFAGLAEEGPLTYVAATRRGGMALTVSRDEGTESGVGVGVTWLPGLTSGEVRGWAETIHGHGRADQVDDTPGDTGPSKPPDRSVPDHQRGADAALVGRGVWRAGPDSPTPTSNAVRVTSELAAALEPVVSELVPVDVDMVVRVVPVGALAMLPVGAALSRTLSSTTHGEPVGVSVAGSARLHLMATRPDRGVSRRVESHGAGAGGRLVAVTNPCTCTWNGVGMPVLAGASAEGEFLQRRYGAVVLDGSQATREATISLLGGAAVQAMHLAMHGDSPAWDPDRVHLLLADGPEGTAESITLGDLPALLSLESVFLASCWTGKPGQSLPDEAQSLPTALVTAGAAAVVAPLWPVYDDACHDLVVAYYKAWTAGNPPAVALATAAEFIRRYALDNHAAGLLNDDELTAWLTTADAFTVTGGTHHPRL